MSRRDGCVALVTGAAQGIGRAIAVELGRHGYTVALNDLQAPDGYIDLDITNRVPMGRFATPDDIARAVAYLADPDASGFVNGQCLTVDGGWTANAGWESLRLSHR